MQSMSITNATPQPSSLSHHCQTCRISIVARPRLKHPYLSGWLCSDCYVLLASRNPSIFNANAIDLSLVPHNQLESPLDANNKLIGESSSQSEPYSYAQAATRVQTDEEK